MTVKEKLQFFSERGMSISFIAKEIGVDNSTLNKWLKGAKGITHKNEEKVLFTLQKITEDFLSVLEDKYEENRHD